MYVCTYLAIHSVINVECGESSKFVGVCMCQSVYTTKLLLSHVENTMLRISRNSNTTADGRHTSLFMKTTNLACTPPPKNNFYE